MAIKDMKFGNRLAIAFGIVLLINHHGAIDSRQIS